MGTRITGRQACGRALLALSVILTGLGHDPAEGDPPRTPCGSSVEITVLPDELSEPERQAIMDEEARLFPLAIRLAGPTNDFNCHGFAFGRAEGNMATPSPFADSYCRDDEIGTRLIAIGDSICSTSHTGKVSGPYLIAEKDIGLSLQEHPWNYGLVRYEAAHAKYRRASSCDEACIQPCP